MANSPVRPGRRVAVALGSGGARGYAHIGALQVLAERDYEVVTFAGTSMGALVAGVAAAGKLEPYTEWSLSLTQREVLRLLDPTWTGGGMIRAERVIGKVAEILEGARIEDLPIPYTAVATDLDARREVWFQRGPASAAIRASIAIPGVFTPIVLEGRLLVDGGLMNPVPIEPTTAVASDWTFAVDLSGPRMSGLDGSTPGQPASPVRTMAAGRALKDLGDRIRGGAAGVFDSEPMRALSSWARFGSSRPGDDAFGTDPIDEATSSETNDEVSVHGSASAEPTDWSRPTWESAPRDLRALDAVLQSFDTMSALITRYRMAGNPPDVLVTVPSDACRTMDFHRAAEMIELGRRLTEETLDAAGR